MDVLIVDDEERFRQIVAETLGSRGHHVLIAPDGRKAIDIIENEPIDLVLLDINMPGLGGIETLRRIKRHSPDVVVAMLTGTGDVETAVDAMKLGADDYLRKPFSWSALEDLLQTVGRKKSALEDFRQPAHPDAEAQSYELVAHDPVMRGTIHFVDRIAPLPSTVLIEGESGTGKELIARRIHRMSGRGNAPFVAFNCAVIPEHLVESELFGYEKGAFTGADARKIGYFEAAAGGVLFIDEISELRPDLQAKLLRVLQERTFRRLGGIGEIATNARIIAATNRDLEQEVFAGRFREDLYYRVNVLKVSLPPLRDRPSDIPVLCEHFIARYSRRLGSPVTGIEPAAMELLTQYRWNGNVRELQNVIERTLAVSMGPEILVDDLPEEIRKEHRPSMDPGTRGRSVEPYRKAKTDFEAAYLANALETAHGNVALASRLTGIARQHFYAKMARYGLEQTEFREASGGCA